MMDEKLQSLYRELAPHANVEKDNVNVTPQLIDNTLPSVMDSNNSNNESVVVNENEINTIGDNNMHTEMVDSSSYNRSPRYPLRDRKPVERYGIKNND